MKKINLVISVCTICLVIAHSANAQNKRSPVSIEQVANPGIENHTSAFQEFGIDYFFNNFALHGNTDWIFDFISLQGNSATIRQYGINNEAYLKQQNGTNNIGYIKMGAPNNSVRDNIVDVLQDGSELISLINVQGNRNTLSFNQSGQSIGAYIEFEGNGIDITANQRLTPSGSNFSFKTQQMRDAIQVESTMPVVPLIIESN